MKSRQEETIMGATGYTRIKLKPSLFDRILMLLKRL
jgi:hypothetical protein